MRHYLNYLLSVIVLLCGGGLLRAQEVQVCDVKNPAVGDRNTTTVEISAWSAHRKLRSYIWRLTTVRSIGYNWIPYCICAVL